MYIHTLHYTHDMQNLPLGQFKLFRYNMSQTLLFTSLHVLLLVLQ